MSATQDAPPATPRRLVAMVVAIVVVGLAATALLANALANRDTRTRAVALDARTREAGERVDASVRRAFDAAVAIRGLVGQRPGTDAESFRDFVTTGGILQGFPRVSALSFARAQPDGSVVVEFIEPLAGNEAAVGLDLTQEPTRRQAVVRARDEGVPTASAPIPLVQDPDGPPGVLLVLPVYANGQAHSTGPERRRNFLGVASMVLRANVLLSDVLPTDSTIDLRIEDVGPVEASGRDEPILLATIGDPVGDGAQTDVNVGDRRWRLTGVANERLDSATPAWLIVLFGGLALTAVGAVLLWSMGSARSHAERLVAERTSELRQANVGLLQADRARSTFLATVSHELRTPLTSIVGFLAILRRQDETLDAAARADLLGRMDRNSRNLLGLIEDLLAFSRLDRGKNVVTSAPYDLGSSLGDILDALVPVLGDATVHRRLNPGVHVTVDPRALDRIATNLVTNAVKYGGDAPTIVVELAGGDLFAEIVVRDDGPGIRPEDHERIFEQFERGAGTISTPGTGIGLTVVRELARQHGGDVRLDPSPAGAQFRVVLPRVPAASRAEGSEATIGAPEGADAEAGEPTT